MILADQRLPSRSVIVVKRVVCMYNGDNRVFWTLSIALLALTVHSAILTILMAHIKSRKWDVFLLHFLTLTGLKL